MAKIKTAPKLLLIALVVGGIAFGVNKAYDKGYFAGKPVQAAVVPTTVDLPTASSGGNLGTSNVHIASANSTYTAKLLTIPWNATMGLQFANGDVTTSSDSLMAKHGVKLTLERQDDYSQMIAQQVAFAKQVSAGVAQPTDGAAFVVIMGDGYPQYAASVQSALQKLGQSAEVIGAIGYSRGEDKCMLPAEMKVDPQKAKGSLIGAVIRDGDWDICVKWAGDNGLRINPDLKTYDPDALNFVGVDAFTDADAKLIAGYSETRPVVQNGKLTGEKRTVTQNGTATWTPGDVKVAKEKGGVVAVASTKEYIYQMPAIIVGNKQWDAANPQFVENMLTAALEGGEQVRQSDDALTRGADVSAKVYKEQTGAYWKKYYQGTVENDKLGNPTQLGGSTTMGLADNAFLFGLNGNDNLYKRVYTVFGNIDHSFYPDDMPTVMDYASVVNTTYLQSLLSKTTQLAQPAAPTYSSAATVTGTFAKKSWNINFQTGKASFAPGATAQLDDLLNQLAVSGLVVQINGHTDNVGNQDSNLQLSKQRAEAVKSWILANASSSFPADRIRVRAFGGTSPIADNATADGRAKNRRVDILLLNTSN
jgi:outer membrane protein OmpA-like peptidoglycan-associated protein